MEKTYILDTSTIISDPNCLENFPDSKIIIPISVLNELDKLKTLASESGKNIRVFIRLLDKFSESGKIHDSISLNNNSILQININDYKCSEILGDSEYGDNKILACALSLKDENPTIVTKDIGFRIKSRALGINAIDHDKKSYSTGDLHSGYTKIQNTILGEKIGSGKFIELKDNHELNYLNPNEGIYFTDENDRIISLARKNCKYINPLQKDRPWNINSKSIEQAFAIDLLLDNKVPLVTLSGIAGTGKTILAVACGLEAVLNKKQYDNLIIYRPIQPVGNDIGFLPGDLQEKLEPWMSAIHDSLDFLSKGRGKKNSKEDWKNNLAQYSDKIHMEALTYIRGRSIPNAYIIIDESQNISKEEIKTVLTRVGHNTKIVLTGDIEQIDNWRLDAMNNGLTYVIDSFKSSELSGHVSLTKGERSELASEAAKIL